MIYCENEPPPIFDIRSRNHSTKISIKYGPLTIRINYFGLEGISGWSQVQVRLRRHIIMCGQCVVGVMCVCVCVCDKKHHLCVCVCVCMCDKNRFPICSNICDQNCVRQLVVRCTTPDEM